VLARKTRQAIIFFTKSMFLSNFSLFRGARRREGEGEERGRMTKFNNLFVPFLSTPQK
jgi:hypothetical protein